VPALVGGAAIAGLRGALWGLLSIQAIHLVLQSTSLKRCAEHHGIQLSWKGAWQERGTLLGFSIPALINSSLIAPINWLCVAMLVRIGGGYSQMGLLQVANTWFLALMFVPGKLAQVYFPMLEDLLASGDQPEAERVVWKLFRYNLVVFSAGALCVSLAAQFILKCYGAQYAEAAPALIVTAWTAAVVASNQPFTVFVITKSRMWSVAFCSAIWGILNLVMAYLLIDLGAMGVATARLISYVGFSVLIGITVKRLLAASVTTPSSHGGAARRTNTLAAAVREPCR
jgi:O-antigen/teichoic acid export membrane protein